MSEPEADAEPKAEGASQESGASWSALLTDLVRSFILLRDFFGYVLPGAFFLLIGAYFNQDLAAHALEKYPDLKNHPWLFILLLVGISYLLGHFIITTSYLFQDLHKLGKRLKAYWEKKAEKSAEGTEPTPEEKTRLEKEKVAREQAEKEEKEKAEKNQQKWSDFLRYHRQFPEIFIEYDRQSILAILRRGLAASPFLGLLVFHYFSTHPYRIMFAASVIMTLNIFANHFHMRELSDTTLKAAKDAATARRTKYF